MKQKLIRMFSAALCAFLGMTATVLAADPTTIQVDCNKLSDLGSIPPASTEPGAYYQDNNGVSRLVLIGGAEDQPYVFELSTSGGNAFAGDLEIRVGQGDVDIVFKGFVGDYSFQDGNIQRSQNGNGTLSVTFDKDSSLIFDDYNVLEAFKGDYPECTDIVLETGSSFGFEPSDVYYDKATQYVTKDEATGIYTICSSVFKLSFDAADGESSPSPMSVTKGSAIGTLPTVSKAGYNFGGWKIGETTITADTVWTYTEDQTAVAQWIAAEYTLLLNADGGDCEMESRSVLYAAAVGFLPVPERIGYDFGGWKIGETEINGDTVWTYTENQTAKAEWTAAKYTLFFDYNEGEGEGLDELKFSVGDMITGLPVPTRDGYDFGGWKIGDTVIEDGTVWNYQADQTAVAQWKILPTGVLVNSKDFADLPALSGTEPGMYRHGTGELVLMGSDTDAMRFVVSTEEGKETPEGMAVLLEVGDAEIGVVFRDFTAAADLYFAPQPNGAGAINITLASTSVIKSEGMMDTLHSMMQDDSIDLALTIENGCQFAYVEGENPNDLLAGDQLAVKNAAGLYEVKADDGVGLYATHKGVEKRLEHFTYSAYMQGPGAYWNGSESIWLVNDQTGTPPELQEYTLETRGGYVCDGIEILNLHMEEGGDVTVNFIGFHGGANFGINRQQADAGNTAKLKVVFDSNTVFENASEDFFPCLINNNGTEERPFELVFQTGAKFAADPSAYLQEPQVAVKDDGTGFWEVQELTPAYTLFFDYNGGEGEGLDELKFSVGDVITGLPVPERVGYDFGGWKIDDTVIEDGAVWTYQEDQTAVAQWERQPTGVFVNGDDLAVLPSYPRGESPMQGQAYADAQNEGFYSIFLQCADDDMASYPFVIRTQNARFDKGTITVAVGALDAELDFQGFNGGKEFMSIKPGINGSGKLKIVFDSASVLHCENEGILVPLASPECELVLENGSCYGFDPSQFLSSMQTVKKIDDPEELNEDGLWQVCQKQGDGGEFIVDLNQYESLPKYKYGEVLEPGAYKASGVQQVILRGSDEDLVKFQVSTEEGLETPENLTCYVELRTGDVQVVFADFTAAEDFYFAPQPMGPGAISITLASTAVVKSADTMETLHSMMQDDGLPMKLIIENGFQFAYVEGEDPNDMLADGQLAVKDRGTGLWVVQERASDPEYTLFFDYNGGEGEGLDELKFSVGDVITGLPYAERTGYSFLGWKIGELELQDGVTVWNFTEDQTAVAQFLPITYALVFDANGGLCDVPQIYISYDAAIENLPVPTRTGYTFVNWMLGDEIITNGTVWTHTEEGTTAVAQWQANGYSVVMKGNFEGAGDDVRMEMFYDATSNLTACAYSRQGYLFTGWNTEADGTGLTYLDGAEIENLVDQDGGEVILYAQWCKVKDELPQPALDPQDLPTGADEEKEITVLADDESSFYNATISQATPEENKEMLSGGDLFVGTMSGYAGIRNVIVIRNEDGSMVTQANDFKNNLVFTTITDAEGNTSTTCTTPEKPSSAAEHHQGLKIPEAAAPAQMAVAKLQRDQAAATGPVYVDIMVAYDTKAAAFAATDCGGVTNLAMLAVARMNTAVENSGLLSKFIFRLVGIVQVAADAGGDLEQVLYDVRDANGAWADVKAKRDEFGADLVSILVDTGSAWGWTGLGWSMEKNPQGFKEWGFNSCSVRSVAISDTMTHEIGHNMGAGHAETSSDPGPQYGDKSCGHYFNVDGIDYHTVMAYNVDADGNYYESAPYFSTPSRSYEGVPVGSAKHDNAGTILQTYLAVSNFRDEKKQEAHTLDFDAAGGQCEIDSMTITGAAPLPSATRTGYRFVGWKIGESTYPGNTTYSFSANKTAVAQWEPIVYMVVMQPSGARGSNKTQQMTYDVEAKLAKCAFTRKGYRFTGWNTDKKGSGTAYADQATVKNLSSKDGEKIDLYAQWEATGEPIDESPSLFPSDDTTPFEGNATYNGWVRDDSGLIAGLLSIKASKPSKPDKGSISKLAVTYTPVGGKKQSIKNVTAKAGGSVAETSMSIPGRGTVKMYLGAKSISAADGSFQLGVDGTKVKATKSAATAALARFVGVKAFALTSDKGDAAFSVTVDKKGKGKLAGTLPDGTEVSVSAQGILGQDGSGYQLAIPFVVAKKASFGCVVWLRANGTIEISDLTAVRLSDGSKLPVDDIVAGRVGVLGNGTHTLMSPDFFQLFKVAGTKWDFGKHNKKVSDAEDPNPYATKLTFKAKDGSVKGTYTYPRDSKNKYTVVGVVIDNVFYGSALMKKSPARKTVRAE